MRLGRFLTDVSVLCLKWQFDGCKIRLLSTLEPSGEVSKGHLCFNWSGCFYKPGFWQMMV